MGERNRFLFSTGVTLLVALLLQVSSVHGDATAFNVAPIYGDEEALATKTVFGFGDTLNSYGIDANSGDRRETPFVEVAGTSGIDASQISPTSVLQSASQSPVSTSNTASTTKSSTNPIKNRIKSNERNSAINSLKERLRKRYEQAKKEEKLKEKAQSRRTKLKSLSSKSSKLSRFSDPYFSGEEQEEHTEPPRTRTFRSRVSRTRTRSSAGKTRDTVTSSADQPERDTTTESAEQDRSGFGRSAGGFGRRRRIESRPSRNRIRDSLPDFSRIESARVTSAKPAFKTRFASRFDSSRVEAENLAEPSSSSRHSSSSSSSASSSSPSSKKSSAIMFKKFNRFDRPDLRKTLLTKFLKNRPDLPGNKKVILDENGDEKSSDESGEKGLDRDHSPSPSALVPSIIDDEDILQNIDNEEIRLERLQTTLLVSTVYPEKPKEDILEIATIRSPYTFDIENSQKSTRFITVTRTFSKTSELTSEATSTSEFSTIHPTHTFTTESQTSTPIFDTASIPAPENILKTSSHLANLQGGSNQVETLPAVILPSSVTSTPPFKTVTESFSTEEYMVKKSILPVIQGSETSYYTLSQTYTVTRHVTALKTIPPMELYEFSPSKSFADFDALFEGAGSENREQLLPGELEFSDQDNFGLEGPSPVRVTPPPGFVHDLDLIGAKLDFVDSMEKAHNPEMVQLKNPVHADNTPPLIHSSIQQTSPFESSSTPHLQLPGVGGLSISPEQLLYLQLLQNPLAALGLGGAIQPQVVTESSPMLRTETVYETNTLKLFQGAKEFSTVLTNAVGITTITDYAYTTKTVTPGLGGLSLTGGLSKPDLQQQQQPNGPVGGGVVPNVNPLAGLLQPSYTIVSSPVVKPTVKTETQTQEIKIIFRNKPTFTTITSVEVITTDYTSYVTKTQRIGPSINPLAGLFG